MSMAQGFAQGFGMMNQYMTQKSAEERQAALDAENNRRYQEGIDYRTNRDTIADARYNDQKAEQDKYKKIELGLKGFNLADGAEPLEMQAGSLYQKQELAEKERNELERRKAEADIGYKKAQTGKAYLEAQSAKLKLSDDTIQAGMRAAMMGDYEGAQKMLPPDLIKNWAKRSPAVDTYIEQAGQIIQHLNNAKTPEEKSHYNDMLTAHLMADTDEAKHLFNTVGYESYMNRVRQDPDIESIAHKSWMPIQGGFVPMMEIKYKEGSGKTSGVYPATKNKSSSPDDIVAVVDGRTLTNRALEAQKVMQGARKMIEENPELAQSLGFKPVDRYQVTYGGGILNKLDGKYVEQPGAKGEVTGNAKLQSLDRALRMKQEELKAVTLTEPMRREIQEEIKVINAQRKMMIEGFPITQGESAPQQAQVMQPTTGGGINPDMIMQRLQMQKLKQ